MDSEANASGPRLVPSVEEADACAPGALPAGQTAFLRAMQEGFLRGAIKQIAERLEIPVTGHIDAQQRVSRRTFLHSREEGGYILALDAQPAASQMAIAFSAGMVARLLRILLGAPLSLEESAPRAVTEIELHILGEIFDLLVAELNRSWKSSGIRFRPLPAGAPNSASGQETLLVFSCRVDLDEAQEGLRIAVPAFLARLAALHSSDGKPGEARIAILAALRQARVRVEAMLPGSTLRMRDLLDMEPGHLLMLSRPSGSKLDCLVNGKAKFQGEWVMRGNRQGLELL